MMVLVLVVGYVRLGSGLGCTGFLRPSNNKCLDRCSFERSGRRRNDSCLLLSTMWTELLKGLLSDLIFFAVCSMMMGSCVFATAEHTFKQ